MINMKERQLSKSSSKNNKGGIKEFNLWEREGVSGRKRKRGKGEKEERRERERREGGEKGEEGEEGERKEREERKRGLNFDNKPLLTNKINQKHVLKSLETLLDIIFRVLSHTFLS